MYVKKVRIENIKGFGEGELAVDLDLKRPGGKYAGWAVLAGRNGSGKSTLLRAIALALVGYKGVYTLQKSLAGWVRKGAENGRIELRLAAARQDKFNEADITDLEEVAAIIQLRALGDSRADVVSPFDYEITTSGREEWSREIQKIAMSGPWAAERQGWFSAGYGPFRRPPLSSKSFDFKRRSDYSTLSNLFQEDEPLIACIAWLQTVYLRRMENRKGAKELEQNVIKFLNDGLLPDGMIVEKIDSEGLWIKKDDMVAPMEQLSDGYKATATFVADLIRNLSDCYGEFKISRGKTGGYQAKYPGVVLVDEMDIHLHVSWQREIGFWLKRHFPNIQFIVTTHSPFICQAADAKGLIRLPGPGDNIPAKHVEETTYNSVINGTINDAILTELFGLDRLYSEPAENMRDELAELESKILDGKAGEKEKQRRNKINT